MLNKRHWRLIAIILLLGLILAACSSKPTPADDATPTLTRRAGDREEEPESNSAGSTAQQ